MSDCPPPICIGVFPYSHDAGSPRDVQAGRPEGRENLAKLVVASDLICRLSGFSKIPRAAPGMHGNPVAAADRVPAGIPGSSRDSSNRSKVIVMGNRKDRQVNQKGFTLIELMIGAVIVGLVAALAVPNFQAVYEKNALKAGSRSLESALKKARSQSVSTKVPHGVYINDEDMTFTVFRNDVDPDQAVFDDGDSVLALDTLPDQFNYVYVDLENNALLFLPNGAAQFDGYGDIHLAAESDNMMGSFSLHLTPATGRVDTYSCFYSW